MQFKWKPGARIKIPAQAAGERIESLRILLGRGVTAKDVLSDAQNPGSPLHRAFEWDDSLAAEQHRLAQAGHLLRCLVYVRVRITHPTETKPRTFTNVRATFPVRETDGVRRFESTVRILGKEELRAQLLENAAAELDAFRVKYRQLRELAGVFAAAEEFRKQLRKLKKRPASVKAKAAAA